MLYDRKISPGKTQACASCHMPYAGFSGPIPAEQAQGPPVDTQEMSFPDTACIAFRLSQAAYRPLFEEVWGQMAAPHY